MGAHHLTLTILPLMAVLCSAFFAVKASSCVAILQVCWSYQYWFTLVLLSISAVANEQGTERSPDNPKESLTPLMRLDALLRGDPQVLNAPMCPKQLLQLLLYPEEIGDKQLGGSII